MVSEAFHAILNCIFFPQVVSLPTGVYFCSWYWHLVCCSHFSYRSYQSTDASLPHTHASCLFPHSASCLAPDMVDWTDRIYLQLCWCGNMTGGRRDEDEFLGAEPLPFI